MCSSKNDREKWFDQNQTSQTACYGHGDRNTALHCCVHVYSLFMLTPVSPQVAPAHSSSIIPVTMVTGSELSQTLMVQLPSQNESKKPRVGQLRETQAESSPSAMKVPHA